ncbi:hypothetical protein TorRG33x02_345540 [Trema orientale]|uniref:Uncharacterized protein n=1 Tax=Trema orientale TaxID=63057 RepID=A0A2P5AP12_TREOI|nr:hypothetical protein TorRG33x02_345540 [Trema orientale]
MASTEGLLVTTDELTFVAPSWIAGNPSSSEEEHRQIQSGLSSSKMSGPADVDGQPDFP